MGLAASTLGACVATRRPGTGGKLVILSSMGEEGSTLDALDDEEGRSSGGANAGSAA